jgi:hypothetical protein
MTLRAWLSGAAVVCVIGMAVAAGAAEKTGPPDLSGTWKLDASRSDHPPGAGARGGPGGPGMSGGGMGGGMEGGMAGGHGMGGGQGGHHHQGGEGGPPPQGAGADGARPGGARPMRLPDAIHVTQTAQIVSFEDTTGAVIREIATVVAAADTFPPAPGAQHVRGTWDAGKLHVSNEGPRGKVTETISLEGKGKTMVIDVKIEPAGDMPPREFKRVYTRVAGT